MGAMHVADLMGQYNESKDRAQIKSKSYHFNLKGSKTAYLFLFSSKSRGFIQLRFLAIQTD